MKVTFLIAMCTLMVLLQQMQASMAKPEIFLEPPQEVDEFSKWILYFHSMWVYTCCYNNFTTRL